MKFKNKNIIITGATGGFGSALAIKYYQEGANLILIGRSFDKLNSLKEKLLVDKKSNQFIKTIKLDLANLNLISKVLKNIDEYKPQTNCDI